MAALSSQSVVSAGTTPSAAAVGATDTIARAQFGPNGCLMRVVNAGGSPDNVSVADPGATPSNNPGTVTAVAVPATTGVRMIYIPLSAISPSTDQATVTHSFQTSVTCELYRI
jgi:hypothetical protein